jgi:hypothetical protein
MAHGRHPGRGFVGLPVDAGSGPKYDVPIARRGAGPVRPAGDGDLTPGGSDATAVGSLRVTGEGRLASATISIADLGVTDARLPYANSSVRPGEYLIVLSFDGYSTSRAATTTARGVTTVVFPASALPDPEAGMTAARAEVLRLFAAITSPADRARLLREFVATRPDLFGTRGADNDCFFLASSNQSADVALCSDWISRWGRPDILIPALKTALDEFHPTPPPPADIDRTAVIALFAAIPAAADRARLLREFVATRPDLFGTRGADNDCLFLAGSNQSADVALCSDWINRWGRPDILIPALTEAILAFRPDGGLGDLEITGVDLPAGVKVTVRDTDLVAHPLPSTQRFEPGTYTVVATAPDGREAQKVVVVTAGGRATATFVAADFPLGDLEATGSGLPEGTTVTVTDTDLVAHPLPFTYKFEPGTYVVVVSAPDGRKAHKSATVTSGGRATVAFTADDLPAVRTAETPPATTGGINVTGQPANNVGTFSAQPQQGLPAGMQAPAASPTGRFTDLAPGAWNLVWQPAPLAEAAWTSSCGGPMPRRATATVVAGQVADVPWSSFREDVAPIGCALSPSTTVPVPSVPPVAPVAIRGDNTTVAPLAVAGLPTIAKVGIAAGGVAALGLGAWAIFGGKAKAAAAKGLKGKAVKVKKSAKK